MSYFNGSGFNGLFIRTNLSGVRHSGSWLINRLLNLSGDLPKPTYRMCLIPDKLVLITIRINFPDVSVDRQVDSDKSPIDTIPPIYRLQELDKIFPTSGIRCIFATENSVKLRKCLRYKTFLSILTIMLTNISKFYN